MLLLQYTLTPPKPPHQRTMKILHLHVKAEYWDAVKRLEKTEEYRLIKPYWIKRLSRKHYDLIYYYKGYPKKRTKENCLVFHYKGFKVKTIIHKQFGHKLVAVYAIRLIP